MVGCVAAKFRVEWWEKLGVVKYAVILFTIPKFKTSISLFYSIKCNFLLLNTLSANLTNHCFILSSHFQPTPSFSFSFLSISLLFSSHLISSISFPLPFFSLFIAISSLSLLWPQTLIHYLIPFHFLSNFTTHNLFFFFYWNHYSCILKPHQLQNLSISNTHSTPSSSTIHILVVASLNFYVNK